MIDRDRLEGTEIKRSFFLTSEFSVSEASPAASMLVLILLEMSRLIFGRALKSSLTADCRDFLEGDLENSCVENSCVENRCVEARKVEGKWGEFGVTEEALKLLELGQIKRTRTMMRRGMSEVAADVGTGFGPNKTDRTKTK